MKHKCNYCGKTVKQPVSAINRAIKNGLSIYCDRVCSGYGRRTNKSEAQKKEEKRLYDMLYRDKNKEMLKEKKAKYFQDTYDPIKAAKERKKNMKRHVEYCRNPEYKSYKKKYDRLYRAKKEYGEEWGEVMNALLFLDDEVKSRSTRHEIYYTNGVAIKKQQRRRDYERLNSSKS